MGSSPAWPEILTILDDSILVLLRGKGITYIRIRALEKNSVFWAQHWEKSVRGGHYYFEIPAQKSFWK